MPGVIAHTPLARSFARRAAWVLAAVCLATTWVRPAPPAGGFQDATAEAGLQGGGRAAWADYDGDGDPDLMLGGRLWRNDAGKFIDVTDAVGLKGNPGDTAVWADFDNDERLDVYFGGGGGALFLGGERGGFRAGEAEANPHARAQGLAAADIDGDGWVDVYLANFEDWKDENTWPYPDVMLRNHEGRLRRHWEADAAHTLPGRGVAFCDFDDDGRVEAYVSNYRLAPNFLWRFDAQGRPSEDIAAASGAAGVAKPEAMVANGHGLRYSCHGHTIGSLWGDFDNDGRFDLFVGNFSHPPRYQDRPQFLRNLPRAGGGPRFEDQSAWAALPWQESYAHPAAGDYDNDGWLDLYFTTVYERDSGRLFRNRRDFVFSDVTVPTGTATESSYQAAWADYDGDGKLDLMAGGRLFRNRTEPAGHWLKLRLRGGHCNRAAIGAVARIRRGEEVLARQVAAGSGSSNQDDLVLHFGLGKSDAKVGVEVTWPCGRRQTAESEPDRLIELREPEAPGRAWR